MVVVLRFFGYVFSLTAISFLIWAFFVASGHASMTSLNKILVEVRNIDGLLSLISFCLLAAATCLGYERLLIMDKNLDLTMSQNNFSNFFKHREFFFSLCESIEDKFGIQIESNKLYREIFPNSTKSKPIGLVNKNALVNLNFNKMKLKELEDYELQSRDPNSPYENKDLIISKSLEGLLHNIFDEYDNYLKSLNIIKTNYDIKIPACNNEPDNYSAPKYYPILDKEIANSVKNALHFHKELAHFCELNEPSFDDTILDSLSKIKDKYYIQIYTKRMRENP